MKLVGIGSHGAGPNAPLVRYSPIGADPVQPVSTLPIVTMTFLTGLALGWILGGTLGTVRR